MYQTTEEGLVDIFTKKYKLKGGRAMCKKFGF